MVSVFMVYGPRSREFIVHVTGGGITFTSPEIEQFVGRDWEPVRRKFVEAFKWRVEPVGDFSSVGKPRAPVCPVPLPPLPSEQERMSRNMRGRLGAMPIAGSPRVESEKPLWKYPSDIGTVIEESRPITHEAWRSLDDYVREMERLKRDIIEATCIPARIVKYDPESGMKIQGVSREEFYKNPPSDVLSPGGMMETKLRIEHASVLDRETSS